MIWSDSRGHCSCQGAQCHVEMEGREGRRGGGCGCFCLWHPSAQLKRSFLHTHTHARTHAWLIHTLGPTSKCRHARVHPPQHTHASHAHELKRGQFREHSCTYTHTRTHAAQHWHTVAVMKPEENGTISYYFQCSNLEGMCFFFSSLQWTYWFFPLNCLETFAYCISSSGPVHIEMNCFLWVLGEIWKTTICFVSTNSCMPFPCVKQISSRFIVRNQICSTTRMLKDEHPQAWDERVNETALVMLLHYYWSPKPLPAPLFPPPFFFGTPNLFGGPGIAMKFTPTLASSWFRSVHFSFHVAGHPRCTSDVLIVYQQ